MCGSLKFLPRQYVCVPHVAGRSPWKTSCMTKGNSHVHVSKRAKQYAENETNCASCKLHILRSMWKNFEFLLIFLWCRIVVVLIATAWIQTYLTWINFILGSYLRLCCSFMFILSTPCGCVDFPLGLLSWWTHRQGQRWRGILCPAIPWLSLRVSREVNVLFVWTGWMVGSGCRKGLSTCFTTPVFTPSELRCMTIPVLISRPRSSACGWWRFNQSIEGLFSRGSTSTFSGEYRA